MADKARYAFCAYLRVNSGNGLGHWHLPPAIYSLGILLENQGVGDRLIYTDEHLGQGVRFTFPVVELEDWRDRWDALDWMIALPEDMELEYVQAVTDLSEEGKMAYITSIERVTRLKTEANMLLRLIERRFGAVDEATTQRIQSAKSPSLEVWLLNILDAETLEDVFRD